MILLIVFMLIFPYNIQAKIGTFWHVTDLHYDVNYTTSGSRDKMCWNQATRSEDGAGSASPGQFGDYECDAPLSLVMSAVQAMANLHPKPDFVLWTGDDTAHVADSYFNTNKVVDIVGALTSILNQSFPTTPFFPILGNHDYYPKNQFPLGKSDLQTQVADLWRSWLTKIPYTSFQADGRYWADVQGTNVTIVALNTLLWYKSNDNTAFLPDSDPNGADPGKHFAWADEVLRKLSARKRRVYIIGHIPPGKFERYQQTKEGFHWFQPRYNDRFIQMIQNHSDVIEAQFFAHHHTDSFRLFFKDQHEHDPGSPVSYLLVAPAVTPWRSTLSPETGANNPAVRLISFDTVTGKLTEVSTYYLDLGNANTQGKADWKLLYNFTTAYGLSSVSPSSLYNLAKNLKTNTTMFERYYRANTVGLENSTACSSQCNLLHWCAITEVDYTRFSKCNTNGVTSSLWGATTTTSVLASAVLWLLLSS